MNVSFEQAQRIFNRDLKKIKEKDCFSYGDIGDDIEKLLGKIDLLHELCVISVITYHEWQAMMIQTRVDKINQLYENPFRED